MRNNARAGVDFYAMILLSSSIAFFGLLQNSPAVIIGAMLVAPLMSPMIAVAHSIVMGNLVMFRRAALSTLGGMTAAIIAAAVMTALLPYIDLLPVSDEIRARTHPNILDQYIALASGAAAAYALSRKGVAAALPGVAIAAALVPPLCVVGYGLGSLRLELAYGAMLLFLTNLAAIIFSSALIFMMLGFRPTRAERTDNVRKGVGLAISGLALVTIPLVFETFSSIDKLKTRVAVSSTLENVIPPERADVRDVSVNYNRGWPMVEYTLYASAKDDAGEESEPGVDQLIKETRDQLQDMIAEPFAIRVLVVDSRTLQLESQASD
jgi:uncharacterized hydrophobic protein (TIGR00271 family)